MNRSAVAAQFDLRAAFNDIVFSAQPGADNEAIIDELDRLFEPWGSTGAYDRRDRLSARAVDGELDRLDTLATVVPGIFLAVAALLLNVALTRRVQLQRPQIASLKALGYSDVEIGWHLLGLVLTIVMLGVAIGTAAGGWLGTGLTELYGESFRFPVLTFRIHASVLLRSASLSTLAALVMAVTAIWRVVRMPAAEAMRPEDPGVFRRSVPDRTGLAKMLGTSVRMTLRETGRHPIRVVLSIVAIAAAGAILVVGRYSSDAFMYMLELQFRHACLEDVSVTFERTVPAHVTASMLQLPGVLDAEPLGTVPVRFTSGPWSRRTALQWPEADANLREIWDISPRQHPVPPPSVLMTSALADALHLQPGDVVEMETLVGERRTMAVELTASVAEPFGMQAYVDARWGREWMCEPPLTNAMLLRINPVEYEELQRRITEMPGVLTVTRKQTMLDQFNAQMGEMMGTMTLILTLLAGTIAVGVVYNNARIALSMRSRDLATLRVLRFTRREIASIFYTEMAIQAVLAIPLGIWLGQEMSRGIASSMDPEIFRLPLVSSPSTSLFSSGLLLGAGVLSALMMRGRLNRLDLIGVLKARE